MAAGLPALPETPLAFAKYEGTGNDFLVVDANDEELLSPARAARLCDRHFGVGADGVLLVLPARTAAGDARMRVINADGSVPEMCGNGARCVALHLALSGRAPAGRIRLETDAGSRVCEVQSAGGKGVVSVGMGRVRVVGQRVIDVDGRRLVVTVADAGNPHAVLFGAFARGDVERLGPMLSTHAKFKGGTNVEFAQLRDRQIDLTVWERGVGLTLACGTGACATVAVACREGRVAIREPVQVRLPGGVLEVTLDEEDNATLRGPARRVFSGTAWEER